MNTHTAITDVREDLLDTAQAIMSGKGFSAVGLNEILSTAGVPKGSFYYYFASKEAFGEALLRRYFDTYLASMDALFARQDIDGAERLMIYWRNWMNTQTTHDPQSKCLVVKLAAEVADLSEAMRGVLLQGTSGIVKRLAAAIDAARADGTLTVDGNPAELAESLYQLWLGASVLAKITKDDVPLQSAMATTLRILPPN